VRALSRGSAIDGGKSPMVLIQPIGSSISFPSIISRLLKIVNLKLVSSIHDWGTESERPRSVPRAGCCLRFCFIFVIQPNSLPCSQNLRDADQIVSVAVEE
jgi:hypothetical protein